MVKDTSPIYFWLSVYESLKHYCLSVLFGLGILIASSFCVNPILLYYVCGILFLVPLLVPLVKRCVPKEKISPDGKAVFISGCDTGFGHMLAQRLDDIGFQVFAGCLFPSGDGAAELRKSGSSRLHVVGLDVTSDSSVQEAAEYVKENLKDNVLWAVVNNAGIYSTVDLLWEQMDTVKRIFEINAIALVRVTKEFFFMLKEAQGRVITVASAAGRLTAPGMVPYAMSKHAAISFSEGLRVEMRKWGVHSISIEPFVYRTTLITDEVLIKQIKEAWAKAPKDVRDIYGSSCIDKYIEYVIDYAKSLGGTNTSEVISAMEESIMELFPESSYSVGGITLRYAQKLGQYVLPQDLSDFLLIRFCRRGNL